MMRLVVVILGMLAAVPPAAAAVDAPAPSRTRQSITDSTVWWPGPREVWDVIRLRDYNTRIVVLGTAGLGLAAGMIGTFMLLRKRALAGDALSHATLPGIAAAFMIMATAGGTGKWLPGLLLGATVTGLMGMGAILFIRHFTKLKEDTALGIVLSVFFGVGIALMGLVSKMGTGSAAGLESFIYGKTASMVAADARLIGLTTLAVAAVCALLFKEFTLLCFDQEYTRSQGWPVTLLDFALMGMVTAVTVIGLQAVGLILVIALLIIPPAAARFWTEHLLKMLVISAVVGALSGMVGAATSALVPRMPAGAVIVAVASIIFVVSLFFGTRRGVLVRWNDRRTLNRRVGMQHLLRAMYELGEGDQRAKDGDPAGGSPTIPFRPLLHHRSWSGRLLRSLVRRAERQDLVVMLPGRAGVRFTEDGWEDARRIVRNHRLWELYLITHADVAPSHVDRDADAIEHVLGAEMVRKLEGILAAREAAPAPVPVPRSPHPVTR